MKKSALVVIDVQEEMVNSGDPVYNCEPFIQRLAALIDAARKTNIPVIYVQHNGFEGSSMEKGKAGWPIAKSIAPNQGETVIEKTSPDAFCRTSLHDTLQSKGIDHLLITGAQTEMCVDTTCRRAAGLDYEVTLISDAHATWDSDVLSAEAIIDHHNNVLRQFAELRTTEQILDSWQQQ